MKQLIFGIFAHPDDAGFGPSGTLSMAARDGTDVHLICVTCGGAGVNSEHYEDLATIREAEEQHAAQLMGVKSLELLRYDDGRLDNLRYLEIANKITAHIHRILEGYDDTINITFITFDPNGISGHLDHIAVSMITTYCYRTLREELAAVPMQLKYFCIPRSFCPEGNTDWLYMPKGRADSEIDETIDVRSVREQKVAIIKAHQTQAADATTHLARGEALFDEHFFYYKD